MTLVVRDVLSVRDSLSSAGLAIAMIDVLNFDDALTEREVGAEHYRFTWFYTYLTKISNFYNKTTPPYGDAK